MDNIHDTSATTVTANYALNGKIMLCSVVILFSVVSAVIFFHAYTRCCSNTTHGRHIVPGTRQPSGVNMIEAVQFAGLDPSVLKTLPTFIYGAAAAAAPPECSVCLSEFEAGERGRSLPECGHVFHAACIDAWFGSQSSCPLCRSKVKPVIADQPKEQSSAHVEIAVTEPEAVNRVRVEPDLGGRVERKPCDLANLALRDDQMMMVLSVKKNRSGHSLKRISSI